MKISENIKHKIKKRIQKNKENLFWLCIATPGLFLIMISPSGTGTHDRCMFTPPEILQLFISFVVSFINRVFYNSFYAIGVVLYKSKGVFCGCRYLSAGRRAATELECYRNKIKKPTCCQNAHNVLSFLYGHLL